MKVNDSADEKMAYQLQFKKRSFLLLSAIQKVTQRAERDLKSNSKSKEVIL